MSFQQLVFEKCLSGFVSFGKKYIREMSIQGNTFKVITVNQSQQSDPLLPGDTTPPIPAFFI